MSKAFTAHQPSDSLSNELSRYSLTQSDHVNGYSELSTPWSDAASVHSPGDDRQSLPASEYFGTSSAAPSRSGSLPPSRHGEPVNFPDKYARYVQQNQRQPVSISAVSQSHFQERNGSFQGDSLPMLGQMGREQIEDESLLHRASFTANGFPQLLDYPAADAGVSRENNANAFSSQRADSYSNAGSGTYTPDSQWQGHTTDPNAQFRTFRFNNRGTPNGTMVRQSPQYSNAHTPPHFNQYQVQQLEQAFTNSANLAMIERRIAGVASVQQQQMVLQNRPPINYQQYPVQHVQVVPNMNLAPSNIRPYYTEMSNAVAFQPAYVQPIQNGMAMAPSGPKDDKPYCPKSPFLLKFRDDFAKGTKKYTLKEIQGYLVEFGGDQSGSRFIQNELTKANSEERARVFDEIYPNAVQLMQDVFGNYVIQKFFELGDQGQKRALGNSMKRKMLDLSTHGYGCRVVQKVNGLASFLALYKC